MKLQNTLASLLERPYVSDIHLTVGEPVWYRESGTMNRCEGAVVEGGAFASLLKTFGLEADAARLAEPRESGKDGTGFAVTFQSFRMRGDLVLANQKQFSLVLRKLNSIIPSAKDLALPQHLIQQVERPTGLVLITGATGSGKSTTLAALLEHINTTKNGHIITVEDPMEYPLSSKMCKVTTREIGLDKDASSFGSALRSAMREDPDVVMIGEVRDYETIRAAMSAGETGHLVLATMHTNSAIKTVDRALSFFPADEKDWARNVLSSVLNCVMSQVLVPRKNGEGRVMGYELMINEGSISSLIRDNKIHNLTNQISQSSASGQILMNAHLRKLIQSGTITLESALAVAYAPRDLQEEMKRG